MCPNVDCGQCRKRKSVEYTERDDKTGIIRLTNAAGHLAYECFGVKKNKGEKKPKESR